LADDPAAQESVVSGVPAGPDESLIGVLRPS
jgi:hypothetical protein